MNKELDLTELKFKNEYYLWFECSSPIPQEIVKKWDHGQILDFSDNVEDLDSNVYLLYFTKSNGETFATRLNIRPQEEDRQDFENALRRKNDYLTLFESISQDGKEICLRFCFFLGETIKLVSETEFAISKKVFDDFKNYKDGNLSNLNQITDYIKNNFSFVYHGSPHYIIDRVSNTELDELENNGEGLSIFSFIGNKARLTIKVLYFKNKKIYSIIGWKKNISYHHPFSTASLISGKFGFKRESDSIKEIQDELIAKRFQDSDSYFKNWNLYTEGLMNLWINEARRCGVYKITKCEILEKSKKKYRVFLDKQINEDLFYYYKNVNEARAWICKEIPIFFKSNISGLEYLESLINPNSSENYDSNIEKESKDNDYNGDDLSEDEDEDAYIELEENGDDEENKKIDSKNDINLEGTNLETSNANSLEVKEPQKKNRRNKYAYPVNFEKNGILDVAVLPEKSNQLIVTLNPDNPSFPSGYICISLTGEFTQIRRCLKAKEDIRLGDSANPQLRAIIEDTGVFTDFAKSNRKEIPALSTYVLEKVFKNNPPTSAQKEAIKLALNTPDILLIQGPPGTGKTTVITAIIERLNEIEDSQKNHKGDVLVSAFQHAAVENIIDRLSVNDLPASNFSQKRSKDENDEIRKYIDREKLDLWITDRKEKIEEKYKQLLESNYPENLENLYLNYTALPSAYSACNLLKGIIDLPSTSYLLDSQNKAKTLMERYTVVNDSDDNIDENLTEYIPLVRSIRTTQESFLDDGPDRAYELLHSKINNLFNDNFKCLLNKASEWIDGDDLEFIVELKKEKEAFINKLIPVKEGLSEDLDDELLNLYTQVIDLIKNNNPNIKADTLQSIIYELYNEYSTNPGQIYNDLNEYIYSFAATTQQCVGANIIKAKTDGNLGKLKFKTVIVDEAARANPPDLLIPMALGEERIILVGDHKQLPQIIEDKVLEINDKESQNKTEVEKIDENIIRNSLFEYLHERLSKLDDYKRIIMLDKQYRMHPLLGNYVSRCFYETNGGHGFESPLKPEQCQHNLEDTRIDGIDYINNLQSYAAVWYDVSNEENKTRNGSRYRPKEADFISKKLKAWMDSDAGQKLSFGIITFFREQVNEICDYLVNVGIMQNKNGSKDIKDEYKYLIKKKTIENREIEVREERLQVGTVDAFQGKEFDVVLLSLVVSPNWNKKDIVISSEDMITAKRVFSRICTSEVVGASKNLLCVAASRQKKLLAIFGDKNLFKSEAAKFHSKELYELLRICEKENNGKYERL